MTKKRYTKLEEEILQILNESDNQPVWKRVRPRRMLRPRPPRPPRTPRLPGSVSETWIWFGGTFGLALLAIIVRDWSSTLAALIAIVSILFFFSPIVRQLRGRPSVPTTQRWRGQDIDLPPSSDGVIGKIRYWLWQQRHR